jgi:hypothetical protein
MWRHVGLARSGLTVYYVASVSRIERISELGTTLAITSKLPAPISYLVQSFACVLDLPQWNISCYGFAVPLSPLSKTDVRSRCTLIRSVTSVISVHSFTPLSISKVHNAIFHNPDAVCRSDFSYRIFRLVAFSVSVYTSYLYWKYVLHISAY